MNPPWKEYSETPRASIGWRMGYGEDYLSDWDRWLEQRSDEQRLNYFRFHLPIPFDWLDDVAGYLGFDDEEDISRFLESSKDIEEALADPNRLRGIRWLDTQGLCRFTDFATWLTEEMQQAEKWLAEETLRENAQRENRAGE